MKIVGEGDARKVVCSCGHKEKYESFEKRKAEEKNSMNKRDVQAYMDSQKKKDGEKKNNAFAALSELKLK
jgi:DNA topoisomerase-3